MNSTYCPFCGQLSPHASAVYSVYDSEATLGGNNSERSVGPFDQDLQETTRNSPPPAIPPVYGAAGAAIPFIPDGASRTTGRKRGRGRVMAGIAAALVVAVILAGAGYTLYNVFAANAENAAARIVPAGTLAFASIDIVQYAENSHNFSINNLFQSRQPAPPDPLKQATGLDWQTDILPWVNRDIAFAAFVLPLIRGERPDRHGNSHPIEGWQRRRDGHEEGGRFSTEPGSYRQSVSRTAVSRSTA